MVRAKIGVAVTSAVIALGGCSEGSYLPPLTDSAKSSMEGCIQRLKAHVDALEAKGYDKLDMTSLDVKVLQPGTEYALAREGYLESLERYEKSLRSNKIEKLKWSIYDDFKGCPEEAIPQMLNPDVEARRIYNERNWEESAPKRQQDALDRMNREIDEAQNDVLEEYRRKAVRHEFTTGPGFRLDQFQMPSGRLVHCKTSISDYGKAVDCN